jgi:lipid-A-disaccharide synthase
MGQRPLTVFISAAEASGDEHAARLIHALRKRVADAVFLGVAGPDMAAAGCRVLADLTAKASMLGSPILRLGYYLRTVRRVQKAIAEIRPDVLVPVDSPAFNWHLAAAARKIGVPVVYYIAPQVWAWAPWRVGKVRRLTDHVACILPFEQRYLWDRGVRATYVGSPVFEHLPPRPQTQPDLAEAWSEGNWRVAMVPGSRAGEIRGHMPGLLATAEAIRRRWPAARCTFTAYTEDSAGLIRRLCRGVPVEITVDRTHEVLSQSHFAVTKSGTVTLEAAYFGVPMVIFYRTSRLLGAISRIRPWVVSTPSFSLVNILAGRRIVPELMPWHGNTRQLRSMVLEVMEDYGYLFQVRSELMSLADEIRASAAGTASDNAAQLILGTLGRNTA